MAAEQVRRVTISELHPFEGHPFKVLDDEAMTETVESIKMVGIANPLIVRPDPDGGYEIISGHRRHHAAELAGLDTIPVIVRELDDDAAVIMMVDSNIQRENILPSEKAMAYKMKMEALRHQGRRTDLTSAQVAPKLSTEQIGEAEGISKDLLGRVGLGEELLEVAGLESDLPHVVLLHLIHDAAHIVQRAAVLLALFLHALGLGQGRGGLGVVHSLQEVPLFLRLQIGQLHGGIEGVLLLIHHIHKFRDEVCQADIPLNGMSDTILRLLEQWQRRRQRDQQR